MPIDYDTRRHEENRASLEVWIAEIVQRRPEEMRPVDDPRACARCGYAPVCGRPGAGVVEWEEEEEVPPEWPLEAA